MEKILKEIEKRKIEKYDIFYEKRIENEIKFEQNEPQEFIERREEGYGLRIIKDGKRGFISFNLLENPEEILERAIESLIYGKEIEPDFPSEKVENKLKIFYDLEWEEKDRIEIGKEMIDKISSKYKDLRVNANFSKKYIEKKILNSNGFEGEFKKAYFPIIFMYLVLCEQV